MKFPFWRWQRDEELDEEIRTHLEMARRDRIERGESPEEADAAVRREFGNMALVKETTREMWGRRWLSDLGQDLRYGMRQLRRSPGFAFLAALTMMLGIGANTTVFSLLHAVLLKPLPYLEPERLVMVWDANAENPADGFITSEPNYRDWQMQARSFERMAIYEYLGFNISGGSEPEQVGGLRVSADLPEVLGVRPFLGRWFTREEEPLGNAVVVLSHRLWQRRYAGDRNIIGRIIRINQQPYTVVGVMPDGFLFPSPQQALWVPIAFNEQDHNRGSHSFLACARLKRGVTLEQARTEMDALGRALAQQYPATNLGQTASVTAMQELWVGDFRRILQTLLLAVSFVLLIACVNIANLLVARGSARQKELGLRTALGAGRGRLLRQLLTESLLLSALGAGLALVFTYYLIPALMAILPPGLRNVPFRDMSDIPVNLQILGFALALAVLAAVLAGLAPALHAIRTAPVESLKEGGTRGTARGGGRRLRDALVAAEVTLALVVLIGAGLMISSLHKLLQVDPGLNPENVMVLEMSLPQPDFYGQPTRPRFCQEMAESVSHVPGIVSAGAVSHLPIAGSIAGRSFTIEGRPAPPQGETSASHYGVACPGFFRTLEIPLLAGRDFSELDTINAPQVTIVNEEFQRKFFPGESPIGRRIKLGNYNSDAPWMTIVGVFRNVRHWGLANHYRPYFFRPYSQSVWPEMSVLIRTQGSPSLMFPAVRKMLGRIDPELPVSNPLTMAQVIVNQLGPQRFPMLLLTAFGLMGLGLAAVGIYGVVSYNVAQRTHEIGIRKALGAQDQEVHRLVLRQGMLPVGLGILFGLAGGVTLTRFLEKLLFGVTPTDPATFTGVVLLLLLVAGAACYLPARRATRVDPIIALRYE